MADEMSDSEVETAVVVSSMAAAEAVVRAANDGSGWMGRVPGSARNIDRGVSLWFLKYLSPSPMYNRSHFRALFRVPMRLYRAFERELPLVEPLLLQQEDCTGRAGHPLHVKLLNALRRLGNGVSFANIDDQALEELPARFQGAVPQSEGREAGCPAVRGGRGRRPVLLALVCWEAGYEQRRDCARQQPVLHGYPVGAPSDAAAQWVRVGRSDAALASLLAGGLCLPPLSNFLPPHCRTVEREGGLRGAESRRHERDCSRDLDRRVGRSFVGLARTTVNLRVVIDISAADGRRSDSGWDRDTRRPSFTATQLPRRCGGKDGYGASMSRH
ncbi:hypothetical protein I4F81_002326 [Pyropia yezoensis]|uniref:Uncharacterized protein n=1 Tax=Pyropia yezoensis TaxID=2788 RepID=A0ACC3BPI4_PYRYE|nr:hypothetical protein I4F81_002326 [Neopyropia yezoensis]